MNSRWEEIVNQLFLMKKDTVDIEKIKSMLTFSRDFDMQVIDSLYSMGILTIDEYMRYVRKYKEILHDMMNHVESVENGIKEQGLDYNPMVNYGLNNKSFGVEIEFKRNSAYHSKDWNGV